MANMTKYHLKLFNLFNIANNNINSTFKLKRKLDWRLQLTSVMEKWNPGSISSFLKDTHIVCSYSRDYRNAREKRLGKQSYLATSREDVREAHTILAYCFTDSLFSFLNRPVMSQCKVVYRRFFRFWLNFPNRNYE